MYATFYSRRDRDLLRSSSIIPLYDNEDNHGGGCCMPTPHSVCSYCTGSCGVGGVLAVVVVLWFFVMLAIVAAITIDIKIKHGDDHRRLQQCEYDPSDAYT